MHRVTARCCFLLVATFCVLSASSIVAAADDLEALRAKAEKGDVKAQTILGEKYYFGIGVPKDLREAAKWFWIAADQGHANAQFNLGVAYRLGKGVPKDLREGAKWYREAADQGDADAQNSLGVAYGTGEGVPKDPREAVNWYRKAADQGNVIAQFNLGNAYDSGKGVPKDPREAVNWYRKAADQGVAAAQNSLGVAYGTGEGVPKDSVTAYAWFNLAAAQGDEDATKNRAIVARQMTRNQIAEAQRLSRQLATRIANRKGQPRAPDKARPAPAAKLAVTGTGFFVTDDGYFVSNAHVVIGASRVQVVTKKGTVSARIVYMDTINDLALLKVKGTFKALPVISSRRLREGSKVFTFGHPNPSIQGLDPVYTSGDISKLSGFKDDPRTFQISVPVQPGNSGGALIDEDGNVVGVVVARLNALKLLATTGNLPQNVNYAVKSTRLLSLLEEHIPKASEKLKESHPRKSRDLAKVRDEVKQATVLILVERGR